MKNGKWTQQLESRSDGTNTITSVGKDNMLDIDGRIRYLTPLECERLMGWPDNWTKYGIDEKGNAIELSDNMRYNIIGNGVVPIVVRNVIEVLMDGLQ
jgi:DNA (cytosine-5)-methyltransferase 1